MKQMRGLLIAAVVLAVLSGLLYWSQKHKQAEASKPSTDNPKILTLDQALVNQITITPAGGDAIELAKLGDRWDITRPSPGPADQDAVNGILSTASSLSADRVIEDKPDNLQAFGLSAPVTKIAFRLKDGKTRTIDLGSDAPTGASTYAQISGDPHVYTVPTYAKTGVSKSLNGLRDKRLLTFTPDKISRVELTAKNQTIEFGKNAQGDWQILKPEVMRADPIAVDDLVRKLQEARIVLDQGKIADATFKAAQPVANVAITDASGAQTAEIRQDKDKNTYAKSSVVDGVYKIGADVADAVKPIDSYRNKKLFDFGFGELSQVTAQHVTYVHSGEKWWANGKEMDGATVLNFVDKLRDLQATGFAKSGGGATAFEVGAVAKDKNRSESVTITKNGGNFFAQRQGEPTIYTMDSAVVNDLTSAANAIKPAAAAKTTKK